MMDSLRHISDLLYNHECVIVPGFGGFVTNYQAAKVHPVQHSFLPPSKTILFNKELNRNDGLLADQIMVADNLPFDEAMEKIQELVVELNQGLNAGKAIDIKNVGKLFANVDGTIQFVQDTNINFLKDSFGMSGVVSPAIRRDYGRISHASKPVFSNRKRSEKPSKSRGIIIRVAAAASFVLLMSIGGINYFNGSASDAQQLSILPVITQSDNQHENIEQVLNSNAQASDEPTILMDGQIIGENVGDDLVVESTGIEIPVSEPVVYDTPIANEDLTNTEVSVVVSTPAPIAKQKMYHLIAGAFLEPGNAETLIDSFVQSGYDAKLIGPAANGYYRVSIQAYVRKDEALAELRNARSEFNPSIWLLRQ